MDKQTIAFVIQSLSSGGAERVVSTLANELSKKYKVVIITLVKIGPFYKLAPEIRLFHCADNIYPSRNIFQALKSNYKLLQIIVKFLKAENVSLVIGFMTSSNVLAILASKFCKIPVIVSERNNPYISKVPFFWNSLRKLVYPKADYLVVQTEIIKKYFVNFLKSNKVKILPNPISTELTEARNFTKERAKVVLTVGSLTLQKKQDLLIRAFAAINTDGWELHIVGRGNKKEEYETLIDNLELRNKVKIYTPTSQIYDHYNSSSIFAFTSIYEGFPNALIEAMHFGLACISTDCPTGPSELINNNINGFLIPMNNQEELQKHLQLFINDRNLRMDCGKQAIETADKFEANKITREWDDLIVKALNQ